VCVCVCVPPPLILGRLSHTQNSNSERKKNAERTYRCFHACLDVDRSGLPAVSKGVKTDEVGGPSFSAPMRLLDADGAHMYIETWSSI
jgi:hypothetical protein